MKRRSLSRKGSGSYFTNTAKTAHPKNFAATPIRGGYRL